MDNIIEFKNVSKTYPSGTHALNNASLEIEKGEFVFIVGASGAGKSTFLKLIMHEEIPSRGTIMVNGVNVTNLKRRKVPYLRRNMGIVFQDFRLIDKMTVYDNVAFAMRAIRTFGQGQPQTVRAFGRRAAACKSRESSRQQSRNHHCGRAYG